MNTGKPTVAPKEVMDKLTGYAEDFDGSGEFVTDTEIGQVKLKKIVRESGKVDKVWYLDMKRIGMRALATQLDECDDTVEDVDTPKADKKEKKKKEKGNKEASKADKKSGDKGSKEGKKSKKKNGKKKKKK